MMKKKLLLGMISVISLSLAIPALADEAAELRGRHGNKQNSHGKQKEENTKNVVAVDRSRLSDEITLEVDTLLDLFEQANCTKFALLEACLKSYISCKFERLEVRAECLNGIASCLKNRVQCVDGIAKGLAQKAECLDGLLQHISCDLN